MSPDERIALQGVLVEYLQMRAKEQPTLLVDVLLSGDGYNLLYQVLSKLTLEARQRSTGLGHLLQLLMAERFPPGGVPARPPEAPGAPEPRAPLPGPPEPEERQE